MRDDWHHRSRLRRAWRPGRQRAGQGRHSRRAAQHSHAGPTEGHGGGPGPWQARLRSAPYRACTERGNRCACAGLHSLCTGMQQGASKIPARFSWQQLPCSCSDCSVQLRVDWHGSTSTAAAVSERHRRVRRLRCVCVQAQPAQQPYRQPRRSARIPRVGLSEKGFSCAVQHAAHIVCDPGAENTGLYRWRQRQAGRLTIWAHKHGKVNSLLPVEHPHIERPERQLSRSLTARLRFYIFESPTLRRSRCMYSVQPEHSCLL